MGINQTFDHLITASHVIVDGWASFSGQVIDGVGFEYFWGLIGLVDNGNDTIKFFDFVSNKFTLNRDDKIVDVDVSFDSFFKEGINWDDCQDDDGDGNATIDEVEHNGFIDGICN